MVGIQRTVSLTGPGATGNRFEPYSKPQAHNSFIDQQPQAGQYNQGQGLASEFNQYQSQQQAPNQYQNQGFGSAAPTQQTPGYNPAQTQGYNQGQNQGFGQVQNPGYQQVAQGYQQGQGYNQAPGFGQGQQGFNGNASGHHGPSGSKSIYVGNLPDTSCKNCLLYNLFAPYGAVESVKGLDGKDSDHKTWFGFVNYVDDGAAERAVSMLDKSSLDGSNLKVQIKVDRPRPPRTDRDRTFVKKPYSGIHSGLGAHK